MISKDILMRCIGFLEIEDFVHLSGVCKGLKNVSRNDDLWKQILIHAQRKLCFDTFVNDLGLGRKSCCDTPSRSSSEDGTEHKEDVKEQDNTTKEKVVDFWVWDYLAFESDFALLVVAEATKRYNEEVKAKREAEEKRQKNRKKDVEIAVEEKAKGAPKKDYVQFAKILLAIGMRLYLEMRLCDKSKKMLMLQVQVLTPGKVYHLRPILKSTQKRTS